MQKVLFAIPVHLDALMLPHHAVVRSTMANYSQLPYTDGVQDINPDTPYIGEAILNHPFQDKNLLLKAGVHLHWSLPRGLTKTAGVPLIRKDELDVLKLHFPEQMVREESQWTELKHFVWDSVLGVSGWTKPLSKVKARVMPKEGIDQAALDNGINILSQMVNWPRADTSMFIIQLTEVVSKPRGSEYPAVPDIWFVRRKGQGQIAQTWILESSYISKTRSAEQGNPESVAVPFHDDRSTNKSQPFRFMGRRVGNTESWNSRDLKGPDYLAEVTAVGYNPQVGSKGYAEPSFAAFYPNCQSVFGFYDPSITNISANVSYEVMGLYANPKNDYLSVFLNDFGSRSPDSDKYFEQLNAALNWEFFGEKEKDERIHRRADIPDHSILFGKAIPKLSNQPTANQIKVAVGNTGTEALSAYFAKTVRGNKRETEELLEAIQFSSKLQNKALDIGHKFQEARHDKGFTAYPGGDLWSIKLESTKARTGGESGAAEEHELTLPLGVNTLLDEVNTLQIAYGSACREASYLRRQLFSDWYKYIVSAYPAVDSKSQLFSADEIMRYIRSKSLPPFKEKLDLLGTISIVKDDTGRFVSVKNTGKRTSAAGKLATTLRQLHTAIKAFNNEEGEDGQSPSNKGKGLVLRSTPAPRFWRANDPVVLFAEPANAGGVPALKNDRHTMPGASSTVNYRLVESPVTNLSSLSFEDGTKILQKLSDQFADLVETSNAESIAIWNPFLLEWQVDFRPATAGSNLATPERRYDEDYIQQHYELRETDPDLRLTSNDNAFHNPNLYTGSTYLTPNAGIRLDKAISDFLKNHDEAQSTTTKNKLLKVQTAMQQTNVLSQSLGGFHEALLMQKQTRQLDIADPLGFPEYQEFAENEMAPLVEKFNLAAPQPSSDFNPIRSGLMTILNLRLIDSFGQIVNFDSPGIISSETVGTNTPAVINMKPRLSQAARLNFRFLSASEGNRETNAHPASSSICGWLLPNHLDRSVVFYDQDGGALGALTTNASNPWKPAPSASITTLVDSIANLHLRNVARYLLNKQRASIDANGTTDNSFLTHFLTALDKASETIDPENFADHKDLAILMGKPIAVVRAKLNFELDGPPATDQSWTQMTHELHGRKRSSDGFTKVKFPIRLGEYKQLNDGLLGYWTEDIEGKLGDHYFSSLAGDNPDPSIKTYKSGAAPLNIFHAIDDEPLSITMLMDPKGDIHATSGILPVKSISLPKDQYQNALKNIAITFLTAPVLTPREHLKISLPREPNYEWTWLEKTHNEQWNEIPQTVVVEKMLFDTKFPDQPNLWHSLVEKKWLQPLADQPKRALMTGKVHRAFPPNQEGSETPFPVEIGKRLDNFFDTHGKRIEPFELHATFGRPQVIREGWLRLQKTNG